MIQPEPEGSTQGYPLVSVEVLRWQSALASDHSEDENPASANIKQAHAGNPVKEILLKLNLPDHRILKDTICRKRQRAEYDESNTYVLERFNTTAGNPVKKILLKLNLSDHRSILTDSKEYLKMVMERQSVKVKEIQERCIIKAFQDYQIKKGMSMSVQKSQVHEMAKFTRWQNEIMLG
ncbi:hypothetical protein Tco_0251062 [Tanacetum coccineum]